MTDGRTNFNQRVARIRAAKPQTHDADGPVLAAQHMNDLATLRRNAPNKPRNGFADSLFELSTVRYGFPIVVGVFGLIMMSAVFPTASNTVLASDDALAVTTDAPAPFPANDIAIEHVNAAPATSGETLVPSTIVKN